MKLTALTAALLMTAATISEARELRLSAAPPPNSPWGTVIDKFTAKVAELSGGALTVKAYMGSKLGGEQDVAKQIARGRIDMGVMSNSAISLLVPDFGILASPYAFETAEQFDCVADNHLLQTFGGKFDAAKVHAISWMEVGYQVVFGQDEIRVPGDLAGVKIRTAPSATDTLYFQAAGATPVPLSPKDAVPAMKTGQVTAASQLSVFGIATGYAAAAPNITLTRHQHQVGAIIVSQRTWDKLSDQEKAWIGEAAPIFLELRAMLRGAEGQLLEKAVSEGATVIDLSAEEMDAWKAVAPQAQDAILDELGSSAAATWDEIQAAKAACS